MRKRGFVNAWQNRHWVESLTAAQGGAQNPNVPPGGTGVLPDYIIDGYKGRGTHYEWIGDELVTWLGEVAFVSPVMKYFNGEYYRFIFQYIKRSRNSDTCDWIFGLGWCYDDGRITNEAGSEWCSWDSAVAQYNAQIAWAVRFGSGGSKYKFSEVVKYHPTMTVPCYNMINGLANMYVKTVLDNATPTGTGTTLIHWNSTSHQWTAEPLIFSSETSSSDIVARAMSLQGHKYWYGGDGRVASVAYANSLRSSYPSIWTPGYYQKALGDVGKPVADCSYLCNYAYGKASPGNHGAGTASYPGIYSRWNGTPKNGMICWRSGHCGIYNNGKTIEMSGIDNDFVIRDYNPGRWSAVFYDKNRNY